MPLNPIRLEDHELAFSTSWEHEESCFFQHPLLIPRTQVTDLALLSVTYSTVRITLAL